MFSVNSGKNLNIFLMSFQTWLTFFLSEICFVRSTKVNWVQNKHGCVLQNGSRVSKWFFIFGWTLNGCIHQIHMSACASMCTCPQRWTVYIAHIPSHAHAWVCVRACMCPLRLVPASDWHVIKHAAALLINLSGSPAAQQGHVHANENS